MLHGFIGGLVCGLNLPSIELKPPTEYTDQAIIGVVFFLRGVRNRSLVELAGREHVFNWKPVEKQFKSHHG